MRLSSKHKIYIKLLVFIMMIGIMVVLNNKQEASRNKSENNTEATISATIEFNGITPLLTQVPIKTEGSLPIKLIANPFSNFLVFVNHSHEFKNAFRIIQLEYYYLKISTLIQRSFLIKYISTARNKAHR